MRIEAGHIDLEEALASIRGKEKMKFAVFSEGDGNQFAIIFPGNKVHEETVRGILTETPGARFEGAGIIDENGDVKWKSSTCIGAFNHDRPDGPEADTLLATFHEQLRNMIDPKSPTHSSNE
jgi:hypothetical protein